MIYYVSFPDESSNHGQQNQSNQAGDINVTEINGVLGHLCAHIGKTGPEEPPEDGEMCSDDTALQTFEIRTLAVCDRAYCLSVMEAAHNIQSLGVSRGETFCFFEI